MNKEHDQPCPPSSLAERELNRMLAVNEHLREQEQEKEPEPIPIEREEFMFNLETTLDYWKDRWMDVQLKIVELENIKAKVIKYEGMGLKTKFFIKGDELVFQAYRRKAIGFNSLANEKETAQEG